MINIRNWSIFRTVQKTEKITILLIKFLPFFSVLIPLAILFFFQNAAYPHYEYYSGAFTNTFEMTWKGRGFYVFFLWLATLEIILGWERLETTPLKKLEDLRTVVLILSLFLPTLYIMVSNYYGLNVDIVNWAGQIGIEDHWFVPLAVEHLVLAGLFASIIFLQYGTNGLRNVNISPVFLATIGTLYMIDNIWRYGKFTPLQILVPTTATLAASVLGIMGYRTSMIYVENNPTYGSIPYLTVMDSQGRRASYGIAWPCSGIESLLIYTLTILLFFRNSAIPLKHRLVYFVFGAVVTFFINILRIATIFVMALDYGARSLEVSRFHDYYGQLYSITWVVLYPLIIIASRVLWMRMKLGKIESSLAKRTSDDACTNAT